MKMDEEGWRWLFCDEKDEEGEDGFMKQMSYPCFLKHIWEGIWKKKLGKS